MVRQTQSKRHYGGVAGVCLFAAILIIMADDAFAFRYPSPRNRGRVATHLPPGHGAVKVGRKEYFHHHGVYYRRGPKGYVVIGGVIAALPFGFTTVIVGGSTYYYYSGVYYSHIPAGYVVVEPPPEVIVVQNPPQAVVVTPKTGERVTVSAQRLNVRSGPGLDFSVIQVVNHGDTLEVCGNAPGWLYVKFSSGSFGWVQKIYTSPESVAASG